jgi:hypothetical protein
MSSKMSVRQGDPARAMTKGICDMTITTSGPFIKTSLVGKKYEVEQASVRLFFYHILTPAHVEIIDDKVDAKL